MEQRVVHVKKDPFDVYIGRVNKRANLRGSVWANPFRIGAAHPETVEPITRKDAIELYKEWIVRGEGRYLLRRLGELEGETLGCWCARAGGVGAHDPLICHGQILLLLLEHRRRAIEKKRGNGSQEPAETAEISDKEISGAGVPERYILFGSRGWDETIQIKEKLMGLPEDAVIVVGGARGADRIAEQVARRLGFEVEVVEVHPAQWDLEGRGAGYRRNERMRDLPGVRGAFGFRMPGESNGTDHMARICRDAGIPTTVQTSARTTHLPI